MCHEASGVELNEVIGKGTVVLVLDDFNRAEAIFVLARIRAPSTLE